MNFKQYDNNSGFKNIGTVVMYYRKTQFLPKDDGEEDPEFLYGTSSPLFLSSCQSQYYLHSTQESSDYSDFSMYGFKFDLSDTDYWSFTPANLYEKSSSEAIYGENFDSYIPTILPQSCDCDYEQRDYFFGRIKTSTETTYLIKVPALLRQVPVFKVEVYEQRITHNSIINVSGKEVFVDYDLLSARDWGEDIVKVTATPILSVYFGPPKETRLKNYTWDELNNSEGHNYYKEKYRGGVLEREYDSFQEVMTEEEYIKMSREELESTKLLYISSSSSGEELTGIDFFSMSYQISSSKHPHSPEKVLRRDQMTSQPPIIQGEKAILDKRSNTILGFRENSNFPWFDRAVREIGGEYSTSGAASEALVNGKEFIRVSKGAVFGENPNISPWWMSTSELSPSCFNHFYLTNKQGLISPAGLVYCKEGTTLKTKLLPTLGYEFGWVALMSGYYSYDSGTREISIDVSKQRKGQKFEIYLTKLKYTLNLMLYNNGTIYTLFGQNTISLKDISLYYLKNGEEIMFQRGNPIELDCSEDIMIRLDIPEGSRYCLERELTYLDGGEIPMKDGYYVISVSDFSESSLSGTSPRYINLSGELIDRKYDILIETESGIQVSTPKSVTLTHGEDFSVEFYKSSTEDPEIEVYQDGELGGGNGINWRINGGIFRIINGIKHNYTIKAK